MGAIYTVFSLEFSGLVRLHRKVSNIGTLDFQKRCDSEVYDPYCASDEISYRNECEFNLKNEECHKDSSKCIFKKCRGKCPCLEGCNEYTIDRSFCDTLDEVSCGSDDITYWSHCSFQVAKCQSYALNGTEITKKCNHVCPCRPEGTYLLHFLSQ